MSDAINVIVIENSSGHVASVTPEVAKLAFAAGFSFLLAVHRDVHDYLLVVPTGIPLYIFYIFEKFITSLARECERDLCNATGEL